MKYYSCITRKFSIQNQFFTFLRILYLSYEFYEVAPVSVDRKVLLSLTLAARLIFAIAFAFSYILMDASKIGRFEGCEFWIVTKMTS